MDFNDLAKAFFNFQVIYICLAIYVLTYLTRRVFEGTWNVLFQQGEVKKGALPARIWAKVIVPILPIIIGGSLSFAAKTFVWPDYAIRTTLARVIYGCICGLFSAFIYNRIRGWIKSGVPTSAGDASEPTGLTDPVLDGSVPPGAPEPSRVDPSKSA